MARPTIFPMTKSRIRIATRRSIQRSAFTLVELMLVLAIILRNCRDVVADAQAHY